MMRLFLYLWQRALKWQRVIKFGTIGAGLFLLSDQLMLLFCETMEIENRQAYFYQTIITYILQFGLNATLTWADRAKSIWDNLKKILPYIPIKVVLWGLTQLVNAFWLYIGFHFRISNALAVLSIMAINYLVFDRVLFAKKGEAT